MPQPTLRTLTLVGSLRNGSLNARLMDAVRAHAPGHLEFAAADLEPLPFYHADLEAQGDPPSVEALKAALRAADLVLIATPEYNGGMPALLKNAIDWGSRPPKPQAWDGKPVAILGASPGRSGTVEAQRALRACLSRLNAYVMPQPRFLMSGARALFDEGGGLTDTTTERFLTEWVEAAAAWGARMGRNGGHPG